MSFFGIDEAALSDPLGRVDDVVQVAAAVVAVVGVHELFAVAGRAAKVRGDNEIALINHVLDDAIERVDELAGRAAVDVDDGGELAVARDVVGDVGEGGDGPLAVAAGEVDEVRLDHVGAANPAKKRVGELLE